jgi:hypothetical protein
MFLCSKLISVEEIANNCLTVDFRRLLVRHPKVLDKLRQEISLVTNNNTELHRADLQKMTYLTNVLKESKYSKSGVEHGILLI